MAGVSVEYYRRLERGNVSGVSDSVLEALARALRLDDAERAHLFDLARAASPVAPTRRRPAQQRVRAAVMRIVESLTAPAIVRNSRVDYLAANPLGRALYAPLFESRMWWAAHNVRYHRTGSKRLRHPVVGELELSYDVMELPADGGLTLSVYGAEPGSRSEEALNLLASWSVTPEHAPS